MRSGLYGVGVNRQKNTICCIIGQPRLHYMKSCTKAGKGRENTSKIKKVNQDNICTCCIWEYNYKTDPRRDEDRAKFERYGYELYLEVCEVIELNWYSLFQYWIQVQHPTSYGFQCFSKLHWSSVQSFPELQCFCTCLGIASTNSEALITIYMYCLFIILLWTFSLILHHY